MAKERHQGLRVHFPTTTNIVPYRRGRVSTELRVRVIRPSVRTLGI